MLTTLATTSMLYGNVEMLTPATSAPISRDNPAAFAPALTMKHHASEPMSMSSGSLATDRKSCGRMALLTNRLTATSSAPLTSDPSSVPNCGSSRLG